MKSIIAGVAVVVFALVTFSQLSDKNLLASVITSDSLEKSCVDAINERDSLHTTIHEYEIRHERINADRTNDVVLKGTQGGQCGSAGCVYELCLNIKNKAKLISFGYAGQGLIVKNVLTNGMHDISIGQANAVVFIWDGTRYIFENTSIN